MSIEVRNVTKRFGSFLAVDDVSLEIPQGSLTAVLGPSGSGKSTLLRIVAGLERPDSGEILLSGEDATRLTPQRRDVGFVFQHYAAFKHMTVRDNVGFALSIRKRPKSEIRERVDELLELVQLQGFGDRPASEFVLRFLGDAFRLGDGFVRPHEILLDRFPADGAVEVEVERIVVVGADVRIELADGSGERMTARLRREDVDQLELVR